METNLKRVHMKDYFWSRLIVASCLAGLLVLIHVPVMPWTLKLTANYVSIHALLEFVGMLVSFSIFVVGWATFYNTKSRDILILSVISFVMGSLDLGHLLSYPGMPDFITLNSANKSTLFATFCRLIGASGFLFLSLSEPNKPISKYFRSLIMSFAVVGTGLFFGLVLWHIDWLPTFYVHGQGLTSSKLIAEWFSITLLLISGFLFFHKSYKHSNYSFEWLGCGCLVFAMGCFFLTLYRSLDDFYNFLGHVYKTAAFAIIYRAVFVECVSKPYREAQSNAEKALEANSSKTRFLANVSHEFRTPLGVITGFSDVLLESKSLDSEDKKWAQIISRNAKQLRILIDDLLDLAKAENEKINVELSLFSPAEEIENVISSLKLQAEKKSVPIRFVNELQLDFKLVSDRLRFSQILLNLTGNAVKFTSVGEIVITLKKSSTPRGVEVEVKDSGIGIQLAHVTKLFQPFSQVDDPGNRRFGGTGLGLALSKKLSVLLGGDLWLKSSEPHVGSVFAFVIPDKIEFLAEDKQNLKNTKVEKQSEVDFTKLTILAAEDSADNQSLLQHYLQPTHAKVVFAQDGFEAVKMTQENRFDLILMDIQMPEMDGFEAVSRLRSSGWQGPILALSAHAHSPEKERALKNGFNDYLTKPISKEKLLERIQFHTL